MKTSFEQSTYMKIYHMIANDITAGVYKAGDIIPTQVELAQKYDVSRATITEAIKELTRRKLVKTQRGKGTFVIVQPLEIGNFKRFDGFSSFRSKHRDRNLTSKVIDVSLIDIPEKVARRFRASETEKVWRVCRVRFVDGTPMSHETSFLLQSYLNGVDLSAEDLEYGSLYSVLRQKAGLEFSYSVDRVKALYCPADIAQHLQIGQNEPVLMINRICGMDEERLVEYIDIVERSDISYTIFQSSRSETEHRTETRRPQNPMIGRKIRNGLLGAALGASYYCGQEDAELSTVQEEFMFSCLRQGSVDNLLQIVRPLCEPTQTSSEKLLFAVLPAAFASSSPERLKTQTEALFAAYQYDPGEAKIAASFMLSVLAAANRNDSEEAIVRQALPAPQPEDEIDLGRRMDFARQLVGKEGIAAAIEIYCSVIGAKDKLTTTIPLLLGVFSLGEKDYLKTLKDVASALGSKYLSGLFGALTGAYYTRSTFPDEDIKQIKDGGSELDVLAVRMEALREAF